MALPPDAARFTAVIDPSSLLPFYLDLSGWIPEGYAIAQLEIAPALESAALGFQIEDDDHPPYQPTGTDLVFYAMVDSGSRALDQWNGAGTDVGVEITITYDAVPLEADQKTVVVKVAQQ